MSDLRWPAEGSAELTAAVHRVAHAVSALGGAVGWLTPPDPAEIDALLADLLAAVAAGDAGLCVADVDGRVEAWGAWRRSPYRHMRHLAELVKIMAHPDARGRGLGEQVTRALVADAGTAGIEMLSLGVRGNNHLAIELYERVGFRVWGRLSNVIEVDEQRFDDVRMSLELGRPDGVVLRGSTPVGPGSSVGRAAR